MKEIKNQKGAAAVEFAIVFPILLVLIFGIIEFSIMLYNKAMITNASREGARSGIVFASPRVPNTDITSVIDTYCSNSLITFGTQNIPVVTISRSGTGAEAGDILTVDVSYHYDFLVLPNLIENLISGMDLTATTVMRME
jgi:Flp pilus assembly protein TadG